MRIGGPPEPADRTKSRPRRPALRAEHPHEDVGIEKWYGPRLGASGDARFRPPRMPTLHEDVGIARPPAVGEVSASMRIGPLFYALRRMRKAFGGRPFYAHSRGGVYA